ncbi:MAG: carbohydrate kinase family protein [Candidatus Nanopelagicales bacterium]|jgi:sugar/nucleoside kinase (ribokinase family)|nr:carbohydrate kinase family protein [Candidatus Nanopelagicales bacterium]
MAGLEPPGGAAGPRVLGVLGDLLQDVVVWKTEPQRHATDSRAEIAVQRGGSAANVAAFAGPRVPTRFLGCVGDDPAGVALRAELASHGVDVRLQVRDRTGTVVVLVDEDGERTMFPSRGASARLQPVDADWLAGLAILHVTAYSFEYGSTPEAVLDAARRVHALGAWVSIDVSSVGLVEQLGRASFLELLTACAPQVISANADEARLLGLADGGRPGPALARFPEAILLARSGPEPTTLFRAGAPVVSVPVPPVPDLRDLTAAGDACNAGYLADLLRHGWDPARNVSAGHALAARVLRCQGASEAPAG